MPKTPYYIVESGNWKVRVKIDSTDEYTYLEAGTRAVEAVFGRRELDESCEIIGLMTSKGQDFFDPDVMDKKIPPPMFSVVTGVCHEDDRDKPGKYMIYLTSELFENASQPVNVLLAKKAETEEPEKVKLVRDTKKKRLNKKKS